MDWMFVFFPPPHSSTEIIIPNVMVFGGGAFGRQLCNKVGTLVDEINTFIRRDMI